MCLCSHAFPLHKQTSKHCCLTGQGCPYCIWALPHCTWAWASWLTGSTHLWWPNSSTHNSTSTSVFPARHPLGRHSPGGAPFFRLPSHPLTGKARPLSQKFTWASSHQEDPCLLPRSWGRGWIQFYLGWPRHTWIGSRDWMWAKFWTRRVGTCQSFQPLQGHHWSGRWNHSRKPKEYWGYGIQG